MARIRLFTKCSRPNSKMAFINKSISSTRNISKNSAFSTIHRLLSCVDETMIYHTTDTLK